MEAAWVWGPAPLAFRDQTQARCLQELRRPPSHGGPQDRTPRVAPGGREGQRRVLPSSSARHRALPSANHKACASVGAAWRVRPGRAELGSAPRAQRCANPPRLQAAAEGRNCGVRAWSQGRWSGRRPHGGRGPPWHLPRWPSPSRGPARPRPSPGVFRGAASHSGLLH
ncbi:hypothetical protein P7K49_021176 [Saguinus oedipus]|uniref:Uncharacterized protein n=1 Tax=Saguinus oedipus TaxID=9490 RepID=A0ABQ9URW7_SAGOE|nr:hypothetical protein P7K49_021176 [Saguinus oedipus]